ncbi:MAG: PilZ domain-containing protein [Polyangiales bacterium]
MFDFLPTDRERIAFRHAVRLDCQVVRERDFKLVARRSVDLSTTGMLLEQETDLEVGEPLIVSFRAPRSDRYVDTEATVARISKGRRKGDVGPSFGVRFSPLDRTALTTLKTSLRKLPATRARRPSRIDYAAIARMIGIL